jgi:hypothetical protein
MVKDLLETMSSVQHRLSTTSSSVSDQRRQFRAFLMTTTVLRQVVCLLSYSLALDYQKSIWKIGKLHVRGSL